MRLNHARAPLPMSMATVRIGTAALMPRVHAMIGTMMTPVPKPATPPTVDATSAAAPRTSQPSASGMAG